MSNSSRSWFFVPIAFALVALLLDPYTQAGSTGGERIHPVVPWQIAVGACEATALFAVLLLSVRFARTGFIVAVVELVSFVSFNAIVLVRDGQDRLFVGYDPGLGLSFLLVAALAARIVLLRGLRRQGRGRSPAGSG